MTIAIHHVRLIDGTGAVQNDATLLVRGTKIVAAGLSREVGIPKGAVRIDGRGLSIIPGLIDCHVHLSGSGEADSQFRSETGPMALKILSNAQKNLAAGITTVRDLGGWSELEFDVRRAIQRGETAMGIAAGEGSRLTVPWATLAGLRLANDAGFDAVVGNPPYIRIQTMRRNSRLALFELIRKAFHSRESPLRHRRCIHQ